MHVYYSTERFLCPVFGGLPSRITKLHIPAKRLFDDALPEARNGLNSHQQRDTDNIDLFRKFGEIF